ncbi:MAG: acyl-CoA/acyl-ACP dehydrogenase [Nitrospirae bacterium]|nr:acyl-CoA/acyl-ACP dehydrogenase [Nitrospirota bacterium]
MGALDDVVQEFRKFARRELAPKARALEGAPDPPRFKAVLDEVLEFGWDGVDDLMQGNRAEADAVLSELFHVLGEETLSAGIGVALVSRLLPTRLLRAVGVAASAREPLTTPLFIEPAFAEDFLRIVRGGEGRACADGRLPLIPLAASADEVLVWFPAGKLLAGLPLRGAGVRVSDPVPTLGVRGCPLNDVFFDSVLIGEDVAPSPRRGEGGGEEVRGRLVPADTRAIDETFVSARSWILSLAAGVFAGGSRRAFAYAGERYQGGQAIIHHSGLRQILSRLEATGEIARATAVSMLRGGATGEGPDGRLAIYAEAIESLAAQSPNIIQVFGGYGYMEDYEVERVYRDVTHLAVAFGRRGFDRVGTDRE